MTKRRTVVALLFVLVAGIAVVLLAPLVQAASILRLPDQRLHSFHYHVEGYDVTSSDGDVVLQPAVAYRDGSTVFVDRQSYRSLADDRWVIGTRADGPRLPFDLPWRDLIFIRLAGVEQLPRVRAWHVTGTVQPNGNTADVWIGMDGLPRRAFVTEYYGGRDLRRLHAPPGRTKLNGVAPIAAPSAERTRGSFRRSRSPYGERLALATSAVTVLSADPLSPSDARALPPLEFSFYRYVTADVRMENLTQFPLAYKLRGQDVDTAVVRHVAGLSDLDSQGTLAPHQTLAGRAIVVANPTVPRKRVNVTVDGDTAEADVSAAPPHVIPGRRVSRSPRVT